MRDRPANTGRYEFRATRDGGTDVTEPFDLGHNLLTKIWRPLGGFLRERRNRRDMLRTLERVKTVAEAAYVGRLDVHVEGATRRAIGITSRVSTVVVDDPAK
jgi:hypothetical protein